MITRDLIPRVVATPHTSPGQAAANDVTVVTYYRNINKYSRIALRSIHSSCTRIDLWPWPIDLEFQFYLSYGHDPYTCINQGQRLVRSKDRLNWKQWRQLQLSPPPSPPVCNLQWVLIAVTIVKQNLLVVFYCHLETNTYAMNDTPLSHQVKIWRHTQNGST